MTPLPFGHLPYFIGATLGIGCPYEIGEMSRSDKGVASEPTDSFKFTLCKK
jgi:hypothetical protein